MRTSEVASIHFMMPFSQRRCMKFWMTRFAFTTAIPKAVMSVTQRMPKNGPTTLTTRRARSVK